MNIVTQKEKQNKRYLPYVGRFALTLPLPKDRWVGIFLPGRIPFLTVSEKLQGALFAFSEPGKSPRRSFP